MTESDQHVGAPSASAVSVSSVEPTATGSFALPAPIRLRGSRAGSFHLALWLLAVCVLLMGSVQLIFGLGNPDYLWALQLFTVVFWIWVAAGIIAWWRRPGNATGPLIVIGGLGVFLGGIGNTGIPGLLVVSAVFATSMLAVAVHLLHAFPSGRLHGRDSIATVVLAYVVSIGLTAVQLLVVDHPAVFELMATIQRVLGLAVVSVTAVILVRRLLAADRAHRRVLLPLFVYGGLAIVLIPVSANVLGPLGVPGAGIFIIQATLYAGLPVAFLLGVLMGGYTRTGELEALSAWLAIGGVTRPAVARALATTLGDESLRVYYWSPDRAAFVDEFGAEHDPAREDDHRGRLEVRVGARLVGAISYDARIIGDPSPVSRAADVLAIAVDRERLTAELLASNEALLQSRLRLVETADRERSRIAQDLHDGLQVQLVLLALDAQKIANAPGVSAGTREAAAELRHGIDEAAADLRRLVHNVLPAALVEQGLTAATEDLVDRLAIPATLDADLGEGPLAPSTTLTAYFVVAEALSNAVKHSRATVVTVRLRRSGERLIVDVDDDGIGGANPLHGSGLRGLVDRVDVLGGTVTVSSPRGRGTRVRAELPCE